MPLTRATVLTTLSNHSTVFHSILTCNALILLIILMYLSQILDAGLLQVLGCFYIVVTPLLLKKNI